jgi:hypothetical protein
VADKTANVCVAVHLFSCPKFKDAMTSPNVGDIVRVPSELLTDEAPGFCLNADCDIINPII